MSGEARRPIRPLAEPVAAQIAAGEVIERPAAVLKELLENAVDAGARRISVEITGAGQERIAVHDDGAGIPSDELALACRRHATSKLEAAADLERLASYGFRGEALPAIAAAAGRFTLTSRTQHGGAWAIEAELGRLGVAEPAARAPGTTVEVVDLFRGQPARRAFLTGERAERAALARVASDLVLARPEIALTLELDGRTPLRHDPGLEPGSEADLESQLRAAAAAAFDAAGGERALWLDARSERAELRLDGLAGAPQDARRSRERLRLFVNGRPVHDRRLAFAVQEAYQGWLKPGQFPLAVARLTLPPDQVDANVHPAKTEVKLRDPSAAFSLLGRAVREALAAARRASPLTMRPLRDPELDYADDVPASTAAPARQATLVPVRPAASRRALPDAPRIPHGRTRHPADARPAAVSAAPQQGLAEPHPAPAGSLRLPPLRMVGQLHRTFIIAEGPEGLVLVDQHGAHERVVYERLLAAASPGSEPARQPLLEPVLVTLDAQEAANWEQAARELAQLGFEAEPFGERALRLRSVPAACSTEGAERLVRGVLADLSETGRAKQLEPFDRAAASAACHSTVRRGQVLDAQAMARLLRDLERCRRPHACPHGRPTLVEIAAQDVLRGFGRA